MSTWGVGRQDPTDEDSVVLMGVEDVGVLAFESEEDAREFIVVACTGVDMPSVDEWHVLSLDEYEGPTVLVQ